MGKILTAQEAAKILGYHVNHVYRLLRFGVIRGKRFNRVWMLDENEIKRVKALQSESGRLYTGER